MGQGVSGGGPGGDTSVKSYEKLKHGITLTDVVIKERIVFVDVPKIKYKEEERTTVVYKPIERDTVRYNVKDRETVQYRPVEKQTTVYVPREVVCEKPVIIEKTYEKPVIVEKVYEKPVIKEKVYEVVSVKDAELLDKYSSAIKELSLALPELKKELDKLRAYRLVEQVVKVPKLEWVTTKAERIEWVPVKREMPVE